MVETVPDSNRHLTCDKKGIFKLQATLPFTPTASTRTSSLCILRLIYNIRGLPTPTILDGGLAWP